ncbi:nicotinate-nicotinamide nucleotide adenylyltransferase [Candidatus Saccharibacteria bacterium]|nr:nicotinate-nicotinamide nucleotide adenylyltransferase [Candidatus Saccharibacteria bacterium]
MAEIAVFGGTFDPPTIAHQAIIEACNEHPLIDEVWVMPSRCRLDKAGMLPDQVRMAMVELLIKTYFNDVPVIPSDFEIGLPAPTETWRTVVALEEAYQNDNFWFVWGADAYKGMDSWEQGQYLKENLRMLVVARDASVLPTENERIKQIKAPSVVQGISSTMIRQAMTRGDDVPEDVIAPEIAKFIHEHALYRV